MRLSMFALLVLTLGAQTFDVVSIKPRQLEPGRFLFRPRGAGLQVRGNTYDASATTLTWLILDAYDVREHQISGLPKWAYSDYFTVTAKSESVPTVPELRAMLQALLADRFQLKLHREGKELPVYLLTVAASGHRMRKLGDEEKVPTYATRPPENAPSIGAFSDLVDLLARFVDRPLLDRTGLTGNYEHAPLDWARFGREMRGAPAEGPSVFAAVQQELGLKIEPHKEVTPILVVDSAGKPTAN
jgi:uncharacterized protein (TIGR03435 family)